MPADAEAVGRLRQVLLAKLGDRAQRYSDEHLSHLIREGYDDEQSLRDASREGLLAAGLNNALADGLRAAFQAPLPGPFTDQARWEMLLCNGVLETAITDTEHVPALLMAKNITSPKQIGDMDANAVAELLCCMPDIAAEIQLRCRYYSSTVTRAGVINCVLGALRCSINMCSSSQQDTEKLYNPQTVKLWGGCEQDIVRALASLPPTPALFPADTVYSDKEAAGEPAVQTAVKVTIMRMVNRLLRYDAFTANQPTYQLQSQKRGTITDSQRKALQEGKRGSLDVDNLAKEAARMAVDASKGDVLDVALVPESGASREAISLGELKRTERLICLLNSGIDCCCLEGQPLQLRGDDGMVVHDVDAPCLHYLWNHPELMQASGDAAAICKNVKGLMSQVARYCGSRGIKYAWAGNYMYTWAIKMDGTDFYVSRAFRRNSTNPSVVGVVYYLCREAIHHISQMQPWKPVSTYTRTQGGPGDSSRSADSQGGSSSNNAGGGSSSSGGAAGYGRSGSALQPGMWAAGGQPGSSGTDSQHSEHACKAQHLASPAATDADTELAADQQKQERLLLSQWHCGDAEGTAAPADDLVVSELQAAAAAVDLEQVLGVIGEGASGLVFSYRQPSGDLLAIKVAPLGSPRAAALLHEAKVLLQLREHWDVHTPRLVAAGAECHNHGYVIATRYVKARYFNPCTDQHLRQQLERALAAAHACGLSHGDLRDSNVLVEEAAGGKQRAWLIDWGHAVLRATQEDMAEDTWALRSLLDSGPDGQAPL